MNHCRTLQIYVGLPANSINGFFFPKALKNVYLIVSHNRLKKTVTKLKLKVHVWILIGYAFPLLEMLEIVVQASSMQLVTCKMKAPWENVSTDKGYQWSLAEVSKFCTEIL